MQYSQLYSIPILEISTLTLLDVLNYSRSCYSHPLKQLNQIWASHNSFFISFQNSFHLEA